MLHPDIYPPLPDTMGDHVEPAIDGHPWLKACGKCAFRPSTDQHACTGFTREDAITHPDGSVFYCVHRTDFDGHHRVCASFAACRAGAGLEPLAAKWRPERTT